MKQQTRDRYCRWIYRLDRFHNVPKATRLTRFQVEQFIVSLSRRYSQSTINQAIRAINLYYSAYDINYKFQTKSTRGNLKYPQVILSRNEIDLLKQALPVFYRDIFDAIYLDLISPKKAVRRFASRGYSDSPVSPQTFSDHIKKAREGLGMTKPATPKTIHQSGIIHYIQDTNCLRSAAEKSGLSDHRITYYARIARKLKERRDVKSPLD